MPYRQPICHVVAGPNGSGKSTFALRYLPEYAGAVEYVNPDLMAQGMSPTDIRLSAIKAGKLTLERITELIEAGTSFAFETTLSGRGHLRLLADAKARGYLIALYYLWMPEPAALPLRISHRVLAGGHDVPTADVLRRYVRSRANVKDYAALADTLPASVETTVPLLLVMFPLTYPSSVEALESVRFREELLPTSTAPDRACASA